MLWPSAEAPVSRYGFGLQDPPSLAGQVCVPASDPNLNAAAVRAACEANDQASRRQLRAKWQFTQNVTESKEDTDCEHRLFAGEAAGKFYQCDLSAADGAQSAVAEGPPRHQHEQARSRQCQATPRHPVPDGEAGQWPPKPQFWLK